MTSCGIKTVVQLCGAAERTHAARRVFQLRGPQPAGPLGAAGRHACLRHVHLDKQQGGGSGKGHSVHGPRQQEAGVEGWKGAVDDKELRGIAGTVRALLENRKVEEIS